MALLYTVPILAFVVAMLISVLGLGTVIYTLILSMRRNGAKPAPAAPAVPPAWRASLPVARRWPPRGRRSQRVRQTTGTAIPAARSRPPIPAATAAAAISAATLPRAGFWIRTGALPIDGILCAIILKLIPFAHFNCGTFLLILATYGAVMWKLRGTTVGGSICHLKVVRLDDRPLDWTCAIVRALSCFLSLAVVGFGFVWVAFDEEKQAWHDKIAGTTVVNRPEGRGADLRFLWRKSLSFRFAALTAYRLELNAYGSPLVGIIMGSTSDWETMQHTAQTLDQLGRRLRKAGDQRPPHAETDV